MRGYQDDRCRNPETAAPGQGWVRAPGKNIGMGGVFLDGGLLPGQRGNCLSKPTPKQRAFEEVAAEHLDALFRTALRYARGDAAVAEDLVQDTLLQGLRAWSGLREPERAGGWLFRILSRLHLNRLRHVARHPEIGAGDFDETAFEQAMAAWSPDGNPETLAVGDAGVERVLAALDTLPAAWSEVFWLLEVEGYSYSEVAGILDVSPGTIASRLYRARAALRQVLADTDAERVRR
ncbi:MAG: sigma-70 family RNA polymerase sigma factor [Rhodanobacteraceae bacterium]|nr:MAG: sigma-70 family RNA polymerase sigma factor [Rhodanobacteraceae bacterium]